MIDNSFDNIKCVNFNFLWTSKKLKLMYVYDGMVCVMENYTYLEKTLRH